MCEIFPTFTTYKECALGVELVHFKTFSIKATHFQSIKLLLWLLENKISTIPPLENLIFMFTYRFLD